MKNTFYSCLLLALLCCSVCLASDDPATGKWDCVSDDGHGAVLHWTLLINDTQGKLSGSFMNEQDSMPLINPHFDGKLLTFKTFINPNCTLLFSVSIDGNKLKGDFKCPEVSGTLTGTKQG